MFSVLKMKSLPLYSGETRTGAGLTDENAVPDIPETPVSLAGDTWIMGAHRIRCGDATDSDDVVKLLLGETADLVFTDTHYNVSYEVTP